MNDIDTMKVLREIRDEISKDIEEKDFDEIIKYFQNGSRALDRELGMKETKILK